MHGNKDFSLVAAKNTRKYNIHMAIKSYINTIRSSTL